MKRLLIVLLLLSFAVSVAFCGTPVNPKSVSKAAGDYTKGRLYFPELEFNFGNVPQMSSVTHSFWLHNKGVDTLEIIQVKPG